MRPTLMTCCGRDHHFAAVASDTPAFEARPNKLAEWNLHDYFLALWGVSWPFFYILIYHSRIIAFQDTHGGII